MKRRTRTIRHSLGAIMAALILLTLVMLVNAEPAVPVKVTLVEVPPEGGDVEVIDPAPGLMYEPPASVSIKATLNPDPSWRFAGWTTNPPDLVAESDKRLLLPLNPVEINQDTTITGKFIRCYTLTIPSSIPGGSVQATVKPGFNNDVNPPVCMTSPLEFAAGSVVTLNAIPQPGYKWTAWTGNATGAAASTEITMDGPKSVSATFALACRTLELNSNEGGSDPAPDKANSDGCSASQYTAGTVINFSATPLDGWRVGSWSGATQNGSNANLASLTFPFLAKDVNHVVSVNYVEKPSIQFNSDEYTVSEGIESGQKEILVTRSGDTSSAAVVPYQISGNTAVLGQDFDPPVSGTVDFEAGETESSFFVTILDDNTADGPKLVDLTLQTPLTDAILGERTSAILRISDDEGPPMLQFETGNYLTPEIDGTLPISVTLSPASTKLVVVTVHSADGTAVAGEDYEQVKKANGTPGIDLLFKPGETVKMANITIKDDAVSEEDESFTLYLSDNFNAGIGEPQEAVVTIEDNDALPTLRFSTGEYFAMVGDDLAGAKVNLSNASGQQVSVDFTITKNETATQSIGTLVFAPGQLSRTIFVDVEGAEDGDEYLLQLSNLVNALPSAPTSANLYVLTTGPSDCNKLTLSYSGYGSAPTVTDLNKSLGCRDGEYVAGELISVMAQPDPGWYVDSWQGTVNDGVLELENVILMPDNNHQVEVSYITRTFTSLVKRSDYFLSNVEAEPNNLFVQANGPMKLGDDYLGGFDDENDPEDRFYFNLDATATIKATLRNIPSGRDYDLFLYDEDWANGHIAQSVAGSNSPEEIVMELPAGKYYLRILHGPNDQPSSQDYILKVELD